MRRGHRERPSWQGAVRRARPLRAAVGKIFVSTECERAQDEVASGFPAYQTLADLARSFGKVTEGSRRTTCGRGPASRLQSFFGEANGLPSRCGRVFTMSKIIKTAIVGTGFMGKVHTENVRRLGNVEVAAVVGSRLERAQKFAEAFNVPKAYGDLNEVLKDPEIAAVHICTPNVDHAPMSKAAVEAGKAVLCEKPLTMTAA